jgi:glutathione synthase/RimK-type ligase-like ATP-grasp enzyme
MILVISTKRDVHVDAVIPHLKSLGIPFIRLNTEDFPEEVDLVWEIQAGNKEGILKLYGLHEVKLSEITACWYRKPFPPKPSTKLKARQAKSFVKNESTAFLEGLYTYLADKFWINYPSDVDIAKHKLSNLALASGLGFEVPNTMITTNPKAAKTFFNKNGGNIITKMLSNYAYVDKYKMFYPVFTSKVTPQDIEHIDNVVFAPTQLQAYIEKKVELRITVVGKKIFACEIHSQMSEKTKIDWRSDVVNVKHMPHKLPKSLEKKILQMQERLHLNFGAYDFILTPDNRYVFIELNPNGQYLWIELLTKMPISEAIAELLVEGGTRMR